MYQSMSADTYCHADFQSQFDELLDGLDEAMPEFYNQLA
jgi:hypothetical protein